MKATVLSAVGSRARSRRGAGAGKAYLEFALDAATLAQVSALAQAAHCTPFQMCVRLLDEGLVAGGRRLKRS